MNQVRSTAAPGVGGSSNQAGPGMRALRASGPCMGPGEAMAVLRAYNGGKAFNDF